MQVASGEAYELARVRPDGRFTRTRVAGAPSRGVIGPDGRAWYVLEGEAAALARMDGEGAVTSSPLPPGLDEPLATDAEGRVLAVAENAFALIAADGSVTAAPLARRVCEGITPEPLYAARASDGAMWLSDGCRRLLRNGAPVTELPAVAYGLTPDAAGGVWMTLSGDRDRSLAHAYPDGRVEFITLSAGSIRDLTLAPDGSAWLALGGCKLARVTADGVVSTLPAPIPTTQLAFDGTGTLWLANRMRVARGLDGTCDGSAPRAEVPKRITLRALARGITVRLREPAVVRVQSNTDLGRGGIGEGMDRPRVLRAGGVIRYRLRQARLRQIERAERVKLTLIVDVEDREGNVETQRFRVVVRR
jgi:streptogramin lyase